MKHFLTRSLSLCLVLLLSSCLKNEFSIAVSMDDGSDANLTFIYRAVSDKQEFVADQTIPLSHGALSLKGITRYPTVVWILSAAHEELMAVYAERGDELQISGKYADPLLWQVKGNKVMEQYCTWVRANEVLLRSRNAEGINAAIAKYVKAHPDDLLSPFLLLSRFAKAGHEAEYDELWKTFADDKDALRMRNAFMELPPPAEAAGAGLPLMPLSLPAPGDTMLTLNPSAAKATVIYFWQDASLPSHSAAAKLLAEADSLSTIQTADVFMGGDTVQWGMTRRMGKPLTEHSLWALGAETNLCLRRLAIPSTPFIIIADAKGKQLYRGADPEAARKVINNIK